ncbi:MAG: DUF6431 domain-containing protein [Clostridiales bacterium]|nr:DUF6431 domain-containing protein [Clostridiales bacterium]
MVITKDYFLELKPGTDTYYVRSRTEEICPFCDGKLKVIGSRGRKVLRRDGSSGHLIIRRLRCGSCRHIHHELPDILVPYKRYDAETIENVVISFSDINKSIEKTSSDYPCEVSTAMRLRAWFFLCA